MNEMRPDGSEVNRLYGDNSRLRRFLDGSLPMGDWRVFVELVHNRRMVYRPCQFISLSAWYLCCLSHDMFLKPTFAVCFEPDSACGWSEFYF